MAKGTAAKVLLVVAAFVIIGATSEEESVPRTPNLHPVDGVTLVPSPSSSTNIPGGGLADCAGAVVATESAPLGADGALTLQVYYADSNGGRTCAMVTKTGTARDRRGELTVTLQLHNYDGRRWPLYATHQHRGTDPRSAGIYLDESNGRCVRAKARFDPDRGRPVTITSGKIGCRWSAPATESDSN
ncbi:MAG TPA: hypothetical protein VK401_02880 [Propionibacteriaceae bacterium]|jgi:hypothetical protein|nr:hypothetical protein [Propionibacteriaceae bacterium]